MRRTSYLSLNLQSKQHKNKKTYGVEYNKHLLEQYKLCVEMADKISSRRCNANNFFLSINTILLTAIGILSKLGFDFTIFNLTWIIMVSFAGILFCWTWIVTIRCYRNLNEAKFEIINKFEQKLPVKAFETEWALLTGENKKIGVFAGDISTRLGFKPDSRQKRLR